MEVGEFRLQENMFLAGNTKYVVRQRKKPTDKPAQYLIRLQPFAYISSLYPVKGTAGTEFTFDYGRELYRLKKKDNTVQVEKL